MSKFVRNIFVLSLLILTAGMFYVLPSSHRGDNRSNQITASAEGQTKVEETEKTLVSLFDSVATASVTLETTSMYGHDTVYRITSAKDLAYLSYKVASGDDTYKSGIYSLEQNIDLSGSYWTPIGTSSNPFNGKFYGNGHTISNITINEATVDALSNSAVGLFGNINEASIMDVRLTGFMMFNVNSSRTKGALIGKTNNSEIINCYDESTKILNDGSTFNSIGSATATMVFLGGSYNGETKNYSSDDEIKSTLTGYTNDKVGRVGFYNLSEGNFYVGNSLYQNPKQVRVLLTSGLEPVFNDYLPLNNLYKTKIPALRENANSTDIYPLSNGKKASIGKSTSLTASSGYIKNIGFADATITVTFNYGYGTRTGISCTFKYDQTFKSFFDEKPNYKIRAGYNFEGLYSSNSFSDSTRKETESNLGGSGYDYKASYPSVQTYYFNWNEKEEKNTVSFKFAIASDESDVFNEHFNDAFAVKEGTEEFDFSCEYGELSAEMTTSKRVTVSNITSGPVYFSFRLNDGFVVKEYQTPNSDQVSIGSDYRIGKTDGIYYNFLNYTGLEDSYRVSSTTNNDSYNNVSAQAEYNEGMYTISLENIVGSGGVVYIVISRTEYEIDLTPEFARNDKTDVISYEWKIIKEDTAVENVAGAYRLKDSKTLMVRKFESPILQITTIVGGAVSKAVIISKTYTQEGMLFNIVETDKENPIANYYQTWKLEIDRFIGAGFIKIKIGLAQTRVAINAVDTAGNLLSDSEITNNTINALGTTINGSNKNLNLNGYFVDLNTQDVIVVSNNGYYSVYGIKVNNEYIYQEDTSSSIVYMTSDVYTTTFKSEINPIFTEIFASTDGLNTVNYTIVIIYKPLTYKVTYEYYFNEQKQTNMGNLFASLPAEREGLIPSTSISESEVTAPNILNVSFTLSDFGMGILHVLEPVVYLKIGSYSEKEQNGWFDFNSVDYHRGYCDSKISFDNSNGGQFNYLLTLGTYNTTVKFYFEFRQVVFKIDNLRVMETDGKISQLQKDQCLESISPTLVFAYDFAKEQAYLEGVIGSLSIHSQFYLLGWYLTKTATVIMNTEGSDANYDDILTHPAIIEDVVSVGTANFNNNTRGFNYNSNSNRKNRVDALVGRREVDVYYKTGEVGKGKFYLNNEGTLIETNEGTSTIAGTIVYGKPAKEVSTLESKLTEKIDTRNDVYFNLGYTFANWKYEGIEYTGVFNLIEGNWYALFNVDMADNPKGYVEWSGFSSIEDERKEVELIAQWNAIIYSVVIDKGVGESYATLKIGDEITYRSNYESAGETAQYAISSMGESVYGTKKTGYKVVGYEIQKDIEIKESEDEENEHEIIYGQDTKPTEFKGAYSLTPENFLKIIAEEYRFKANSASPILITSIRKPIKYTITLENSEYYSYAWTENKYGEIDKDGKITFEVSYDNGATNLTNALDEDVLSIERMGYSANGWVRADKGGYTNIFHPSKPYQFSESITIAPTWKLPEDDIHTVSSTIAFTDGVGDLREFYLTNSHDITIGGFAGRNIDEGDSVTDADLTLNNGEEVEEYYFAVTIGEKTTKYESISKLNINIFDVACEVSVKFYVTIIDTLTKITDNRYTAESEELNFEMVRNNIHFVEYDLHSTYNGTNEFVEGKDNKFGSFIYRYGWNGTDRAQKYQEATEEQRKDSSLFDKKSVASYFNYFLILGDDFNAGDGKSLRLQLNKSKFSKSKRAWDEVFANVYKEGEQYFVNIENELTIDKAEINIEFGQKQSLFMEGIQPIVKENSDYFNFNVEGQTFIYTYSRIKFIGNAPGEYRGQEKHLEDIKNFMVEGLYVEGYDDESREQNFEWIISKTSVYNILELEPIKLQFETRYFVAEDGVAKNTLSSNYNGIADGLYMSQASLNGKPLTTSESNQYNIFAPGNELVFSIVGAKTSELSVYINPLMLSKNISFTISVDYKDGHDLVLYPLEWCSTSLIAGDYTNSFEVAEDNSSDFTTTVKGDAKNSLKYVVLTDVVKVKLDYNGGKRGENSNEILYLNHGSMELSNPTYSYEGISFAGYTNATADNLSVSAGKESTLFEVSKGGRVQSFKAKWNFDSIVDSIQSDTLERYASKNGINLKIEDIVNVVSGELFISKNYDLKYNGNSLPYDSLLGQFEVKNEKGQADSDLSGEYTIYLEYTFNDGVQSHQKREKSLTFTLNIFINTVKLAYTGGDIVYSNSNKDSSVLIDYVLNGNEEDKELVSVAGFSIINDSKAVKGIYVSCNKGLSLKNAGEYNLVFKVADFYLTIYQFDNETKETSLTLTVKPYEIMLADYQNKINNDKNLEKIFGRGDPSPLAYTLEITQNSREKVTVEFTRDEGEGIGEYNLYFSKITSSNASNYSVNSENFGGKFKIKAPTGNLKVDFKEQFEYDYNGYALGEFLSEYNGTNYTLSAKAGSDELSINYDLYYEYGYGKIEIPQDQKDEYARLVKFSTLAQEGVGSYYITAELSDEGKEQGWLGVDIVTQDANIIVNKRVVTVAAFEKVFDQTSTFVYNNVSTEKNTAQLTLSNVVYEDGIQDEIALSGVVSSPYVGEVSILKINITNGASINYDVVVSDTLDAKIVADDITEVEAKLLGNSVFEYGKINSSMVAKDLIKLLPLAYNNETINSKYLYIKDIEISEAGYSQGGYLNCNTYKFVFTIASTNFTFGGERQVSLTYEYTMTTEFDIEVAPISLSISNSSLKITKEYDGNALVLDKFVGQDVNSAGGYYTSTSILAGDKITVESAQYNDEKIGNLKPITLTFANDDSQNYTISTSVEGDITKVPLIFNKEADTCEFVDGDKPFENTDAINIDYVGDIDLLIEGIVAPETFLSRVGYVQVDWSYKGINLQEMTTEQKSELLADAVAHKVDGITLDAVWEIAKYKVKVQSDFATASITEQEFDYYSDIEGITVEAIEGYTFEGVSANNDNATVEVVGNIGNKNGEFKVNRLLGEIVITILTEEIEVKIIIDYNAPEGFSVSTDDEDWGILRERTFKYSELSLNNLPILKVNKEGRYTFSHWTKDGEVNSGENIWARINGESLTSDNLDGIVFVANWSEGEILLTINSSDNAQITVKVGTTEIIKGEEGYLVHYLDDVSIIINHNDWYKWTGLEINGEYSRISGNTNATGEKTGSFKIEKILSSTEVNITTSAIQVTFMTSYKELTGAVVSETNGSVSGVYAVDKSMTKMSDVLSSYVATSGTYLQSRWKNGTNEIEFTDNPQNVITLIHGSIPTKDITLQLEAVFEGVEYTVTFQKGSETGAVFVGSDEGKTTVSKKYFYGEKMDNLPVLENGTKDYIWRTSANEIFVEGQIFTTTLANAGKTLVVTADWDFNLLNVYINLTANSDKVLAKTANGIEFNDYVAVNLGGTQAISFALEEGYELDEANTSISSAHADTSIIISGYDITVVNVRETTTIDVAVKVKSYTITFNETGFEEFSNTTLNINHAQNIETLFNGETFSRGGYVLKGFNVGSLTFASFADGSWIFSSVFVKDKLYIFGQDVTLDAVWQRDENSTFITSTLSKKGGLYYNGTTQTLAEANIVIESGETFALNKTFENGDKVKEIYYILNETRVNANSGYNFEYQNYLNNASLQMIMIIEDVVSGQTYTAVSNTENITLERSEVVIDDDFIIAYYTGTSSTKQLVIGSSYGKIYFTDDSENKELLIDKVEIIDTTEKYNVGENYKVKYFFNVNESFNENNYSNLTKEGGYYTLSTDQMVTHKVYARIIETSIKLNVSGVGFENGKAHNVSQVSVTVPDYVVGATIEINSVKTISGESGTYNDSSKFDIDWTALNDKGEDIKSNFKFSINGYYTIKPNSSTFAINVQSKYLAITSLEDYDGIISVSSVKYGTEVIDIEEDKNYSKNGEMIFSIASNGTKDLSIIVANGKQITINFTISQGMQIVGWTTSLSLDGALGMLQNLEQQKDNTFSLENVSTATTVSAIVTDYKAILLDQGEKGEAEDFAYIKLGGDATISNPQDWAGFDFARWYSEDSGITIDGAKVSISSSEDITVSKITAIWALSKPKATAKTFSTFAKVDASNVVISLDDVLVNGIENENEKITYSYEFLKGATSLSKDNYFELEGIVSSSGSYTLKITATKQGYGTQTETFGLNIEIKGIIATDVVLSETTFEYANLNYMTVVDAKVVGAMDSGVLLSNLTQQTSPYCYFTIDGEEIKNVGTYNLTLNLSEEVFDIDGMADDFEYTYQIVIDKADLQISQEDIPAEKLEKLLGMEDPDFTFTVTAFDGANEEEVEVTLTRREGEGQGQYAFNGITTTSPNFNVSLAGDIYFTIKPSTGALKVVIEETLTSVYSGQPVEIKAEYDDKQGIWTIAIGDSSSTIQLLYQSGENFIELTGNLYKVALEDLTFIHESAINAGKYDAKDIKKNGVGNFATIEFEGEIEITTKPLEISNITKTFDRADNIIASKDNLIGLVDGDVVTLSGKYNSVTVGENIALIDLKLEGEDCANYHLASEEVFGTITPLAISGSSIEVQNTSFVYGQLGTSTPQSEILSLVGKITITIDGITTDFENDYVQISSVFVLPSLSFSNSGKLKVGEQTITITLSSENFTGLESGYQTTISVAQKTVDLSGLTIAKDVDGTTSLPSDVSVLAGSYFYTGDKVEIDMDASGYENAEVGNEKKVTIVLKGDDSANYAVVDNVVGKINAFSITLQVNADTEHIDLVTDGAFVDDGINPIVRVPSFKVGYPADNGEEVLESLVYPKRTGYKAVGWKYFDGTNYLLLTSENILSILEEIANDEENVNNALTIYVVWAIEYYNISIVGDNISSYNIISQNLEGNDEDGFKLRYFSDVEIEVSAQRGYKIKSYLLQGSVENKDFSDIGENTGKISIEKISSELLLQITTESMDVTFNIDLNLPEFTERTDTNDLSITFGYSELENKWENDLKLFTVTEGTYYLEGFIYKEETLIGDASLKSIVDGLYATIEGDIEINLTASWKGEEYQIIFDANGGIVKSDYLTISAVYGSVFDETFPVVVMDGKLLAWTTSDGVVYEQTDILKTVGEKVEEVWTLTLKAEWESGAYKLTMEMDDKILVRVDGAKVENGDVYELVYGEGEITVEASCETGYSYLINDDNFWGSLTEEGGKYIIKNLTANSTLKFEKVCEDNTLTLTLENVADFSVEIDGQAIESSETIVAKTENNVSIIFNAKPGYEFDEKNIFFIGNGKLEKTISIDKKTLTVVWSNFVDDANLQITAEASANTITIVDMSEYVISIMMNGQSIDVGNGTFIAKTGQKVSIQATLKYGYEGGSITTSVDEIVVDEVNEFNNADKNFHYSSTLEGFTSDFTISFTAIARTYGFEIKVQEGQEDCGQITSQNPQYVKFGEHLVLSEEQLRYDYIFESWKVGDEVVSLDKEGLVLLDETRKDMLESAKHGDLIVVYATYIKRTLDVEFTVGLYGKVEVYQEDNLVITIESSTKVKQEILLGQDLVLKFIANKGYEINQVKLDNSSINLTDYGFTNENNTIAIYQDINAPTYQIEVLFKTSEQIITVQVGTKVGVEEFLGTSAGGYFYASNSSAEKLDESVYRENNGKIVIGVDYTLACYTNVRIYFIAIAKSGFTVNVECSSSEVVINQFYVKDIPVYSFTGINEPVSIKALYVAKENKVNVQFALEGDTEVAHAGIIAVDSSSNLVSASPNRGAYLDVAIVTGENLSLEIYSSFSYSLIADELGYLKYQIIYNDEESSYDYIKVGNVVQEDSVMLGYTYSSTLEIMNVNADATILIFVEAKEYTIKFKVSDIEEVVLPEKVRYGEWFELSSLSSEQRSMLFPTREEYTFDGYYTHPLGQGRQYIGAHRQVVSAWYEDGFEFDGTQYVPEAGFNPDENIFTLYISWIFNKASIEINFLPGDINKNTNYNITDVITNLLESSAWTDQTKKWYAEVGVSASLSFRALSFDNYEFAYWEVVFDKEDPVQRPANFILTNLEVGKYTVRAVYNPCFKFIIECSNTGNAEGGRAELLQDGRIITGNSLDREKIATIRALPVEGYRFSHWVNLDTSDIYQGTTDADGINTYTFADVITSPLNMKAVFIGKNVSVTFDSLNAEKVHSIRTFTVNGKRVDYDEPFSVCVGDTLVFTVRKAQGYGIEIIGVTFEENYDNISEIYTFTYTFVPKDLTIVDRDNYAVNIIFNATREKLNLKFSYDVLEAVDSTEKAKAGKLIFINAKGEKFDVKEGVSYQIEYGDVVTLRIEVETNYRLKYIYLKNPEVNDVTSLILDDELIINESLLGEYFAKNISFEVYFERLVWIMEEFRATSLVGQGTENNPYEIYTAEELALVAFLINHHDESSPINYAECYYVVKEDLDFFGKYWEPIGTAENPFNGYFNLGDHEVKNVTHYKNYENPKTSYGGLFWHIGRDAEIIQAQDTLWLIIMIVGSVVGLGVIILVIIRLKRKHGKGKLHKAANG